MKFRGDLKGLITSDSTERDKSHFHVVIKIPQECPIHDVTSAKSEVNSEGLVALNI